MKIEIANPAVITAMASAAALAKKTSPSDIYLNIHIQANEEKGMKVAVLCEGSVTFEQTFSSEEVTVVEAGEVFVNSARFATVIKTFQNGPCRLENKEVNQGKVLRISRTQRPIRRTDLPICELVMPEVPNSDGHTVTLNAELLKFAVKDAENTMGENPYQPVLQTERLLVTDGEVTVESTDGNRCTRLRYQDECVGSGRFSALLPKAVCKLITSFIKTEKPKTKKAKEDEEDEEDAAAVMVNTVKMSVNHEKKAISVKIGNIKITYLALAAEYPNTSELYKLEGSSEIFTADGAELKSFARNLLTVVTGLPETPPAVVLGFTPQKVLGTCESRVGKVKEELICSLNETFPYKASVAITDAEVEDDLFVIGMNPYFISDASKSLEGEVSAFAYSSVGPLRLYATRLVGETEVEQAKILFPVRLRSTHYELMKTVFAEDGSEKELEAA